MQQLTEEMQGLMEKVQLWENMAKVSPPARAFKSARRLRAVS